MNQTYKIDGVRDAAWKRCEDCDWMIIRNSSGQWVLFLVVAPFYVDYCHGKLVPNPAWKPPRICEATGRDHR
jgi:hypothetical protein